jgi:hypothetical protein
MQILRSQRRPIESDTPGLGPSDEVLISPTGDPDAHLSLRTSGTMFLV